MDLTPISGPPPAAAGASDGREVAKVRQVAQDFEAMMLSHMLASMRQAASTGKPSFGSRGQEIYRQMLDDELGKTLAKHGGFGFAEALARDLLRQGAPPKNRSSQGPDLSIDMAKGGPPPDRLERGLP